MTPFAELPQWIDMGPDQDFATPTSDLAGLLKKRMSRKSQGGVGMGAGAALDESPGYSGLLKGAISSPQNGVKSL